MALLTIEMLPVTFPAAVGENARDRVELCPAPSVSGTAIPFPANPAPIIATDEMLTLLLPLLVTEIICVLLVLPTMTLPKLRLLALGESNLVCAIPFPAKAIFVGEFVALLITETLPVTLPVPVGE